MENAITLDDLMAAYREAGFTGDGDDEGATRLELREAWRCSERTATKYLRMAQAAGILKTGYRMAADISGRQQRIPVYSFVQKPTKRKVKR